jgi:hypothetical protein
VGTLAGMHVLRVCVDSSLSIFLSSAFCSSFIVVGPDGTVVHVVFVVDSNPI